MDKQKGNFKVGDIVLVFAKPGSAYKSESVGTFAKINGMYHEEDTGKVVYETTIGRYYEDQLKPTE